MSKLTRIRAFFKGLTKQAKAAEVAVIKEKDVGGNKEIIPLHYLDTIPIAYDTINKRPYTTTRQWD